LSRPLSPPRIAGWAVCRPTSCLSDFSPSELIFMACHCLRQSELDWFFFPTCYKAELFPISSVVSSTSLFARFLLGRCPRHQIRRRYNPSEMGATLFSRRSPSSFSTLLLRTHSPSKYGFPIWRLACRQSLPSFLRILRSQDPFGGETPHLPS